MPFIAVVKLRVGVHAFPLAAPVPLPLVDEPVVDLLQIQRANPLQVLLLYLLNTIIVRKTVPDIFLLTTSISSLTFKT